MLSFGWRRLQKASPAQRRSVPAAQQGGILTLGSPCAGRQPSGSSRLSPPAGSVAQRDPAGCSPAPASPAPCLAPSSGFHPSALSGSLGPPTAAFPPVRARSGDVAVQLLLQPGWRLGTTIPSVPSPEERKRRTRKEARKSGQGRGFAAPSEPKPPEAARSRDSGLAARARLLFCHRCPFYVRDLFICLRQFLFFPGREIIIFCIHCDAFIAAPKSIQMHTLIKVRRGKNGHLSPAFIHSLRAIEPSSTNYTNHINLHRGLPNCKNAVLPFM